MFTFNKHERLCSRQLINETLTKGDVLFVHPFKLYYVISENQNNPTSLLFAISVPKRQFKRAIDRNRIKRLVRESYRLNKSSILNSLNFESKNISLFIIYIDKNIPNFETTNSKIKLLLQKLTHTINRK